MAHDELATEGPAPGADRQALLRRGRRLEVFTIAWNTGEAVASIAAGLVAGSIALVGFGGDSVIETVAAAFVLLRLSAELNGAGPEEVRSRGRRAMFVIGGTFLLLAAYIVYDAVSTLASGAAPAESAFGIVVAALSLVVMPILAWRKKRTGEALDSPALVADSTETFVCAYLSFTLLLGLGLNALVGWWWADPVAALTMVPVVAYEGWATLEQGGESPSPSG